MRPLKVAVAVPIFPNLAQTYILRLIAGLKSAGMSVAIIAANRGQYDRLPQVVTQHGMLDDVFYVQTTPFSVLFGLLTVPLFNSRYRKSLFRLARYSPRDRYGITYWIKAIYRLHAVAFREFEIIHSHSLFSSHNLLFMKTALGIPMIMTYHGQVPQGVPRLPEAKVKQVLGAVDACVVNTDFAHRELIELGCDSRKIRIIPQGIDVDDFPFVERGVEPKSRIVLLTIGRLSIEKGHDVAIRSLKLLENSFPGLEYHLVGDGPRREYLAGLADELGVSDRVRFHGFQTGDALKRILSQSHLFVLPSINTGDGYLVETQGVVLQEAQSSGIPVIASKTGGIPEVIRNGYTGLLFDEGNVSQLSHQIDRLIGDADLYESLCKNGRKDVEEHYAIEVIRDKLIGVYNSILNKQ